MTATTPPHDPDHHELEDHDRGLSFDLQTLMHRKSGRRGFVAGAGALGAVGLVGLGGTPAYASRLAQIPEETAGPFPGDGSNGPDVLGEAGIVRSDIRSSFDGATGRAEGFPFYFTFTLRHAATGRPARGLAVYAWHCNRDGEYSMYGQGITQENYLRGVQVTNAHGRVSFRTIYPACYSGRWPHVHFEVYRTKHAAITSGTIMRTSQMALPQAPSSSVYQNVAGYEASVSNLAHTSLSTDNVFGNDGGVHQIPHMSGSLSRGYFHARLRVPVKV